MSGWQDHSFNKPKTWSHSCCLPWHAGAAQTLDQVLKANQENSPQVPNGQSTTHGILFSLQIKKMNYAHHHCSFPSLPPQGTWIRSTSFSLPLLLPLELRDSPNLNEHPQRQSSQVKLNQICKSLL